MVFDTLHAVSITTPQGAEILIHIGLDTVTRKGEGFTSFVKNKDTVKKGDLLLTADLEALKAAGFDTITPVVICNTDDYKEIRGTASGEIKAGADLIEIVLK